MKPALSVIICTHNPRADHIGPTLDSLRAQHPLAANASWELLLVDNASTPPLDGRIDLSWHPDARIVREDRLGLTHARLRGFHEAQGEILACIDDDNILDPDYLSQGFKAMTADRKLGGIGGKSIPVYEAAPPPWFDDLGISLACRDLGDEPLHAAWDPAKPKLRSYPKCAPIGAGMVVRRAAYAAYVEAAASDPVRTRLGRKGSDLASGEDNDMVLSFLSQGWSVAYLPQLRLQHLIPARRLTREYLARYAYSSSRTWIQVLAVHGMRPWPRISAWTVPLRKMRAFLRAKAWASDGAYVNWCGACGHFEARALLDGSR